jgi:hypothetical protein
MGGNIPFTIRRHVIKQWLNGDSRDQIAKDNDIGAGTVSAIIKQCKQKQRLEQGYSDGEDSQFELIRELAIMLKRKNLDVDSFASSVRLHKKLEDRDLNEEQVESLIEDMDVHCFKRGMNAEEFINTIHNVSGLSRNLEIPVEKLVDHLRQQEKKVDELREEIENLEMTEVEASWKHAMEKLGKYVIDRPVQEKLEATEKELAKARSEIDYMEELLFASKREIHRLNYERAIPIDQLLVNKRLDKTLERQEFSDMSKGLHHHLAKYPEVIAMIRERRHLRYPHSVELTKSS